jgi:hypothetical protein
MNLRQRPTIHGLRSTGSKDAAILDLLHLLELHEPPVRLRVAYLQNLWGCSQSQVSRRMTAINELGFHVENCRGRYRLSLQERKPQQQDNRQRWAALQQHWQEAHQ